MKRKVVIFDLDGTAIDSPIQKLPYARLITAIRKLEKKYFLCAATGRVWTFAKPVLQGLGLTDPCIISAGTQICDPTTGAILWQQVIDDTALKQALAVLKQYPEHKLLHNDGTEDDYFFGGVSPLEFTHRDPVYFLEQIFVPDAVAHEVYKKLQGIPGITCVMVIAQRPGTRDLHIINHEATKEHAVAELIKRIGIKKENAIGIGDSHNDIHLFRAVGYKVAMGNAIVELKESADTVIGSVSENGLAAYFETL